MEKLLIIIITVFAYYWMLILGIVFIGNKTMNEAKEIVSGLIKDTKKILSDQFKKLYLFLYAMANKQQEKNTYNVFIGSNGCYIKDDIVNEYFSKLERYFEIWYFEFPYNFDENVIVYQFKVYNLLNKNFPRTRVLSICRQICEQALVRHWHELGDFTTHVDNFVAVTWQADTLRFHIAMNDNGINKIAELRKQSH